MVTLPVEHNRLHVEALQPREDVVICAPGHRLASRATVDLAELAEYPLALLDQRSTTRQFLDARFSAAGLPIRVAMELGSIEVIKRMVELDFRNLDCAKDGRRRRSIARDAPLAARICEEGLACSCRGLPKSRHCKRCGGGVHRRTTEDLEAMSLGQVRRTTMHGNRENRTRRPFEHNTLVSARDRQFRLVRQLAEVAG